jgi:hypothetical protein
VNLGFEVRGHELRSSAGELRRFVRSPTLAEVAVPSMIGVLETPEKLAAESSYGRRVQVATGQSRVGPCAVAALLEVSSSCVSTRGLLIFGEWSVL